MPQHRRGGGEGRGSSCDLSERELKGVGGGNPKFCFINYKIQTYVRHHAGISREDVNQRRRAAAMEYDSSEDIQKRWKSIFQAVLPL